MIDHNEIIEYIYESIVKRSLPLVETPQTLRSLIAPLTFSHQIMRNEVSLAFNRTEVSLAFNRDEFLDVLNILIAFERHTKPRSEKSLHNHDSSLARTAEQGRRHNPRYKDICLNNTRLYELYDLMHKVDDDYIAYIMIRCMKLQRNISRDGGYIEYKYQDRIEFSVGASGFDIMYSDRLASDVMRGQVQDRWRQICHDEKYFGDYSMLIDQGYNSILFMMDYAWKVG